MNIEIEHIAVTLQGAETSLGNGVAGEIEGALIRALSRLKLRTAGRGVAQVDLGVVDVPPQADACVVSDLIAARLVEWLTHEQCSELRDVAGDARPQEGD